MTNKEIEKRFLFDLEMGRFLEFPDEKFKEIQFKKSKMSFKLLSLLYNIGYITDEIDEEILDIQKFLENKKAYLNVSIDYELVDVYKWRHYEDNLIKKGVKYFNQIPKYISQYKINPES